MSVAAEDRLRRRWAIPDARNAVIDAAKAWAAIVGKEPPEIPATLALLEAVNALLRLENAT